MTFKLFSSFVYKIFDVAVIELRFSVPVTNILHSCQDIAFKYVRFLPNNELKSCLKLLAAMLQEEPGSHSLMQTLKSKCPSDTAFSI